MSTAPLPEMSNAPSRGVAQVKNVQQYDQAREFYDSNEYGAARKAREGIAVMRMVLVEGV